MKFLSLVGNSFGCSASGERLVSAARDGDLQEAKALLEYNPRLARYSTFGIRNSPLHYSAAQGHHEIVTILLESGVDINLRNYRGQTALMQACQYGHWEVVQALIIFKANIHKADYLNGGTALHLAALNGRSRCIRLLLADYIPSIPDLCSILQQSLNSHENIPEFDKGALHQVINRPADGGITSLHMAALNGHTETVQLLLDMGASVTEMTVEDGSTIDLIGAGSTSLHYAACGGNAQCCQILVDKGASLTAENANGWTPLMVARSWHRDWLEDIFTAPGGERPPLLPSPYLCLPLMSVIKIARDCGWRGTDCLSTCMDPCVVCLERECTVEAKGCSHEFCVHCALYLCSTSSTSIVGKGPPGSIACPLCRHGIVSFSKLERLKAKTKEVARTSLSLPFCTCSAEGKELTSLETPFCKPEFHCNHISPCGSAFRCNRISPCGSAFRSLSCSRFPLKLHGSLCMGAPDTRPSLVVPRTADRNLCNLAKCSRSTYRRSNSQTEAIRSWLCSFSHSVVTSSGC